MEWLVLRIARRTGDLRNDGHRAALSEDGVPIVEMRRGHFSDEELRAIGGGAGVRHRQAAGLVEPKITELVFELVARVAGAVTQGIAALDHESWNHPVKDSPVVQRLTAHLGVRGWISPFLLSGGESDEVVDCHGCLVGE